VAKPLEVKTFLSRRNVAEGNSRPAVSFLFAKALRLQLNGLKVQMRLDLVGKVFRTSPAPEHALSLLAVWYARGSENQTHRPRQLLPLCCLFREMLAPLCCERIKPRLPVAVAYAPFSANESFVFEALEREIERAVIYKEDVLRLTLYDACDFLAMEWSENDGLQNEHVESALQEANTIICDSSGRHPTRE
jgi:hypothetical protein